MFSKVVGFLTILSLVLWVFVFGMLFSSCSNHQETVNQVSDVMSSFNFIQKEVELFMIDLNDKEILADDSDVWLGFKNINAKLYPISVRLNQNWKLLPDVSGSAYKFLASKDFIDGIELLGQLFHLAIANGFNKDDVSEKFNSLSEQHIQAKQAVNQ